MKFVIMSDLHLEDKDSYNRMFSRTVLVDEAFAQEHRLLSTVLVAGDLSSKPAQVIDTLRWLATQYATVCFTFGNHEYYGHDMHSVEQQIRHGLSAVPNVHVLQNELIKLEKNCYVWAGTLWTDFNGANYNDMFFAKNGMNDFRLIRTEAGLLKPEDTVSLHRKARISLNNAIDQLRSVEHDTGIKPKLIVMTHHAPTHKGTDRRFIDSPLNHAFSSNMDDFIRKNTDLLPLWVHGHKHNLITEHIGNTMVMCNPMGYRDELAGWKPRIVVLPISR
jgi:predicted phosphohydrolase